MAGAEVVRESIERAAQQRLGFRQLPELVQREREPELRCRRVGVCASQHRKTQVEAAPVSVRRLVPFLQLQVQGTEVVVCGRHLGMGESLRTAEDFQCLQVGVLAFRLTTWNVDQRIGEVVPGDAHVAMRLTVDAGRSLDVLPQQRLGLFRLSHQHQVVGKTIAHIDGLLGVFLSKRDPHLECLPQQLIGVRQTALCRPDPAELVGGIDMDRRALGTRLDARQRGLCECRGLLETAGAPQDFGQVHARRGQLGGLRLVARCARRLQQPDRLPADFSRALVIALVAAQQRERKQRARIAGGVLRRALLAQRHRLADQPRGLLVFAYAAIGVSCCLQQLGAHHGILPCQLQLEPPHARVEQRPRRDVAAATALRVRHFEEPGREGRHPFRDVRFDIRAVALARRFAREPCHAGSEQDRRAGRGPWPWRRRPGAVL